MTISRPLLENLLRIRNLDENRAFREFLEAEAQKHDTYMRNANEDRPLAVAQGMSRATHALLDLIEQAPSLLDKGRQ